MRKLRELFEPASPMPDEEIVPAPATAYSVRPLTAEHLPELMRLSVRCFRGSETYNRETFEYLLREPRAVAYRALNDTGDLVAFIFLMSRSEGSAHVTTIAVAPEHRKRGVAREMLKHAETALAEKGIGTLLLEVRVSNYAAQNLYANAGFVIIQKLIEYYSDGEDAYLMSKDLET